MTCFDSDNPILKIPAGPELDKLVIEKMGWHRGNSKNLPISERNINAWESSFCWYDGTGKLQGVAEENDSECFSPSTNIAHAFQVVAYCKEYGGYILHLEYIDYEIMRHDGKETNGYFAEDKKWNAWLMDWEAGFRAAADTPEHAICLVFLTS